VVHWQAVCFCNDLHFRVSLFHARFLLGNCDTQKLFVRWKMTPDERFQEERKAFKLFLKNKTRAQHLKLLGDIYDAVEEMDKEELYEKLLKN